MGSAGNSEQGKIVVGECITECILRMDGYAKIDIGATRRCERDLSRMLYDMISKLPGRRGRAGSEGEEVGRI
jgi:hypothetical protein